MSKISAKIKIFSWSALSLFTLLSVVGGFFAARIPTDYSMAQFQPPNHALLKWDQQSKKVFQISEASPHILLMQLPKGTKSQNRSYWYDTSQLEKLEKLSAQLEKIKGVNTVVSLGNIKSAFDKNQEMLVAPLNELRKKGFNVQSILKDPLFTPNLISKDGLYTAVFVLPNQLTQDQHHVLLGRLTKTARLAVPEAQVTAGGPAGVRTQIVDLLSQEIFIFIFLSLLCAVIIVKVMFHGNGVIPQMLFMLVVSNLLALGLMGVMQMSFNILLSTLPVIITITSLGIASHTLVRMAEAAHLELAERLKFLKCLMRELVFPHLLTAGTTSLGFGALMASDVPLISDFGKAVSIGVMAAAIATIILIPSLYVWFQWPRPRNFLKESPRFAYFLVHNARWLTPAIGCVMIVFLILGTNLSWTARLFDDLPANHSGRRSTDLISQKLGGVTPLDLTVGSVKAREPWKQPANIEKLKRVSNLWRRDAKVGSVLTIADFLASGPNKTQLPTKRAAIAELQFLYSMSGDNPIPHFLSSDEKWTRLQIRLPDLPANENQALIRRMKAQLQAEFPQMEVRSSGLAAVVPLVNNDLSKELMKGFFSSLFWIVLLLALSFRSLRWAMVAVLPNLVPPALLLGVLALFDVPIKPGIAIIFSISLGIAFVNTVYVLERLKHMLKSRSRSAAARMLPIYTLMKNETMPCLVSSLSLFGGFGIFLFSVFPVNKLFGVFMLISIAAGVLGDLVWLPAMLKRFPWLLVDTGEDMKQTRLGWRWQVTAKVAPYVVLFVLGIVAFSSAYAAQNVKDVLKTVAANAALPNERTRLRMVVQESDGSKKIRELTIIRTSAGGDRALVRLLKPTDLKGLALLTMMNDGKEEQYLYLPSDKKSRRILGSGKKGKFLDSEIAYEDLSVTTYKDFNNKVISEDKTKLQIESRAKPNSESSYSKLITQVSLPDYKVERIEYYDLEGKLLKRAMFKNYKKIANKYWRAHEIQVHNVQANRKTNLLVQKMSLAKINQEEISLSALEE